MPLLPFDLILTVGTSAAVFVLGLMVWARNKWNVGTVVYWLMAICLSFWVSADWFVNLQSTALPFQVFFWKLFFYACVSFGPALAVHVGARLVHRMLVRRLSGMYAAGFLVFWILASGLVTRWATGSMLAANDILVFGASVGVGVYIVGLLLLAMELYPVLFVSSAPTLLRRRAAYGAIILIPFLVAGALQLVVGPFPTGFLMPFFAAWFLIFSLLGFSRASLLEVEINPLEAFFLLLTAFAIVIILRSRDRAEVSVAFIGAIVVGTFGLSAIRLVRGERSKRQLLEATNRQMRRVEEAKGDFVDMVAHQLRGPLGGIRSAASMLEEGDYGPLPEKARSAASLIMDSSTRLLSLADTFLNASRLELGTYKSVRVATPVREEIQSVVSEMASAAASKHLKVTTFIADDLPATLVVDREVLRHVIFNLLDNAIKYTEQGKIDIACRLDGKLLIDVKDTGQGMAETELHQLFQKFHRGNAGHAHAVDGTGLGLFIVKRLVEAAGGSITATSPGLGLGSQFFVALPFDPLN